MNIYLVRNGEYDKNSGLLTELGLSEVQKASEIIANAGVCSYNTLILSSPQPRTVETAKPIARAIGTCHFKVASWLDVDKEGEYIFNEGIPQIAGRCPQITNLVLVTHEHNIASFAFKTGHTEFMFMVKNIETGDVFEINLMESRVQRLTTPVESDKIVTIADLTEAFAA